MKYSIQNKGGVDHYAYLWEEEHSSITSFSTMVYHFSFYLCLFLPSFFTLPQSPLTCTKRDQTNMWIHTKICREMITNMFILYCSNLLFAEQKTPSYFIFIRQKLFKFPYLQSSFMSAEQRKCFILLETLINISKKCPQRKLV